MERLKFDSQGKLTGVDGALTDVRVTKEGGEKHSSKLQKGEEKNWRKFDNIKDSEYWSLYGGGVKIEPLKFSNGKTQEDIVREIVGLIKNGKKVIFLHGMCGTGKSAIALNIARVLGKAAVIVPVKNLQRQYEEDYMGKMYLVKPNG